MNNKDAFIEELNTEVNLRRDEYPLQEMAFAAYVMEAIAPLTNVSEHYTIHCVKRRSEEMILGEIHGYGISEDKEVLYLYYSLYSSSLDTSNNSILRWDFDKAINRMQRIYDYAIRGEHFDVDENTDEYEVFKFIYDNQENIKTLKLCVLSNCSIGKYEIKSFIINGKNVIADIWDIKKLYANLHHGLKRTTIDLDFEGEYSVYKLPFWEITCVKDEYSYISTAFPAVLLYRLYEKYNTDLLWGNVRIFKKFKGSERTSVNTGIRKALREESGKFLAYNNGITAMAQNIEYIPFEKDVKSMHDMLNEGVSFNAGIIKGITGFRVIDGEQTIASIYETMSRERLTSLAGTFVSVKILVIKDSDSPLPYKVIKTANSHSRINPLEFCCANRFNLQLEQLSRSISAPDDDCNPEYWFYERVQGQYNAEKEKFHSRSDKEYFLSVNPTNKKFSKEEYARVWVCWNQKPHEALRGSKTTFSNYMKEIEESHFMPDESYFKNTVVLLIIYRFILSRPESKEYGYGKASVAAYTLAYLNMCVNGKLNFEKIWNQQSLSESLQGFIGKICNGIAEKLYSKVKSLNVPVLSYTKRSDSYDFIKSTDFGLDINDISDDLIPR
jgi:hypothetical protein